MRFPRVWRRLATGFLLVPAALLVTACSHTSLDCRTGSSQAGELMCTAVMPETDSGTLSVSFGSDPISVTRIAGNAVTFTAPGASVTIPSGSSAAVGPYQVTVTSVGSSIARFQVVPRR